MKVVSGQDAADSYRSYRYKKEHDQDQISPV